MKTRNKILAAIVAVALVVSSFSLFTFALPADGTSVTGSTAVSIPTDGSTDADFTASLWLQPTSVPSTGITNLLTNGALGWPGNFTVSLDWNNGTIMYDATGSNWWSVSGGSSGWGGGTWVPANFDTSTLTDGNWHQITISLHTSGGVNALNVYLDGQPAASITDDVMQVDNALSNVLFNSGNAVTDGSTLSSYEGLIDTTNVAITNVALSASEVMDNYNSDAPFYGAPIVTPGASATEGPSATAVPPATGAPATTAPATTAAPTTAAPVCTPTTPAVAIPLKGDASTGNVGVTTVTGATTFGDLGAQMTGPEEITTTNDAANASNYSVGVWLKPDAGQTGVTSLMSAGGWAWANAFDTMNWYIDWDNSSMGMEQFYSGGAYALIGSGWFGASAASYDPSQLEDGSWHYLSATVNTSDPQLVDNGSGTMVNQYTITITYYVDGMPVGTTVGKSGNPVDIVLNNAGFNVQNLQDANGNPLSPFSASLPSSSYSGQVGSIKIYDSTLSACQVIAEMGVDAPYYGMPLPTTTLVPTETAVVTEAPTAVPTEAVTTAPAVTENPTEVPTEAVTEVPSSSASASAPATSRPPVNSASPSPSYNNGPNLNYTVSAGGGAPITVNSPSEAPMATPVPSGTSVPETSSNPPVVSPGPGGIMDKLTTDHIWYMRGYPDNTFKPDRAITRAEVALALYRLLTADAQSNSADNMNFTDVSYSDWYGVGIATLTNMGVLQGYPDGSYQPNKPITRAEMAALMARVAGTSQTSVTVPFADVQQGYWAYDAIASVYAQGLINGYPDGTFKPNKSTTRAEFATLMNTVLGRGIQAADVPGEVHMWSDLSASYWAFGAIMEATNSHDYTGTGPNEQWTQITGNGLDVAYNQ